MAFSINVASVIGSFKVVPRHAQFIVFLFKSDDRYFKIKELAQYGIIKTQYGYVKTTVVWI